MKKNILILILFSVLGITVHSVPKEQTPKSGNALPEIGSININNPTTGSVTLPQGYVVVKQSQITDMKLDITIVNPTTISYTFNRRGWMHEGQPKSFRYPVYAGKRDGNSKAGYIFWLNFNMQ